MLMWKIFLISLLMFSLLICITDSQTIMKSKRRFPGQRRMGATKYTFYYFGKDGYKWNKSLRGRRAPVLRIGNFGDEEENNDEA